MRLSRKKAAQVQLQAELNTDEDWRKFLLRDGLLVVDVYSEWCGPCIGMVGNLKKIKVEIGGDNLHLAIAKADTIEVLKRFRNRSEPTWMFIAAGQLLNVVFGADAPRLARTIEQELKYEELARKGERQRPSRLPHELTPEEQVVAEALAARLAAKQAREREAVLSAREARREARARRLEAHFAEVCPVLMMPHSQKHLRKVADALEPLGVTVADKCPLLVGAEGARILAVEEPALGAPPALAALVERPSLTLLLKKLPEKEGDVLELVRRGLCGDGLPDEEKPKKTVLEELTAEGVPGLFVPADRHARAVALDLLFPKMVGSVVEPPAPPEPPHIALVYGAWQRRAVLAAAAALTPAAPVVLRYGFFADASVDEPRLLCKTLEKYEERPEKDYCETLVLMAAVGPADPVLSGATPSGPPAALLALGPLHASEDAVAGAVECARFFPPGYSEPEHKPKQKIKKKKKKRESKEGAAEDQSQETPPTESGETEAAGDEAGDGDGDEAGEGEGDGEEGDDAGGVDKATSPPPQT